MSWIGVDGCKAGWVVAEGSADLSDVNFSLVRNASELFARIETAAVAAIDIPIGLPINKPRTCDIEARRRLVPHGSRVFPAPSRSCLNDTAYAACCQLNQTAMGVGLSRQSHALLPKIREIDQHMSIGLQERVREAHPEVTFITVAGRSLIHSKKTVAGNIERFDILHANGLRLGTQTLATLEHLEATLDDVLDAAACLLTARRIAKGTSEQLGDGATDIRGLRMEILV